MNSIISIKISFSSRGKNERFFRQTIPSLQFRTEHLHTHKRPSVSSPEKMEQTLLLAGRRHASFLCSSSSLSLSKKLKKNRGGGGGALFSRFIFLTDNFSKSSDPFFSLLNLAQTVFLSRLINYQEETEY